MVTRLGLARFAYGFFRVDGFSVFGGFLLRVYVRVSYGCVGFRFF